MQKMFGKGSTEWAMFQDFWILCQKIWEPETSDKYWEDVRNKVLEYTDKYRSKCPLAHYLGVALLNYLNDKGKEIKKR